MLVNGIDTNKFIREKAIKRLYELSLKSLLEKTQSDKPNYEQRQWLKKKENRGPFIDERAKRKRATAKRRYCLQV